MFKRYFRKSFLSISYVGFGTVLNAGLGFLYLSTAAKFLSVSEFGKYALLATLLLSMSKFLDFGTNSIYVSSINEKDPLLPSKFISVKMILFLIAAPVSVILLSLFELNAVPLLISFLLGLVFYGINYSLFGLFQKIQDYTALIFLNLLPALVKGIAAVLIFAGILEFNLVSFFTVFALSILTSAFMYFFLPKNLQSLTFDFSSAVDDIKKSFSPGISLLINESFSAVSNGLAKIYSTFSGVGIFSIAEKISSIFVLVSFTIFTVLLPKNAERKRARKGYDHTETLVLALGIALLSAVVIVASKFLIPWFFENKYDDSLPLLNILVISGGITAIHTFMENYFFVENKTRYLAYISVGKLGALVLLAATLTPIFQLQGLAYAHLLSSIATLAVMVNIILKNRKLS